jgi:hypothetical protein
MKKSTIQDERYTLEAIASAWEVRDEREEALWRAFVEFFAKNHEWQALFTEDEILRAYHTFLRSLLNIAASAWPDN